MRKFTLTLLVLIFNQASFSQSCLPEGITFTTQAQIDNFQTNYPNCEVIEGEVTIYGSSITNLNGLSVLTYLGDNLSITHNAALTSLTGLGNLTKIGGNLWIDQNDALTSLTGLDNLNSIWSIWISSNNSLTSLSGLGNVTSTGGELKIGDDDYGGNPALTSLTGLGGLTSIGGWLYIAGNDILTTLAGLDNIDDESISGLSIYSNNSLSTCAVESICDYLKSPGGDVNISGNAPGCNSPEEVEAACPISVDENGFLENQISIYPNPSNTAITIELPQTISPKNTIVTIYNLNGQQLINRQITEPTTVINVGILPNGIYFLKVTGEKNVSVGKFIK